MSFELSTAEQTSLALRSNINSDTKKVYVILSQTGTLLSRILKAVTGAYFNHSSISLDKGLDRMYSFGRIFPKNPFIGGFVHESPHYGTFRRFFKTRVMIFELTIPAQNYEKLSATISDMSSHREMYHYNYLGLFLAALKINHRQDRHYYCSEFVRAMLVNNGIVSEDAFEDITQPIHFMTIPCARFVYSGMLQDYAN